MKNELIHETSPYLLQHAHNPVHWQPWGENALKLAQNLDKPLLVSIGYSACHWCHVMERESFENPETAALMNDHFICVKIDREERPDIDHIYMDAVQAMTGSGGWPLNVFLTPAGKPFYGGTYFPPVKAYNRASWPQILVSIHDAWANRREEMEAQAEKLTEHLKTSNRFHKVNNATILAEEEQLFTKENSESLIRNLMSKADKDEGGFGNAPKFPQTFSINLLLQAAYLLKDNEALTHAELSLQKMLNGGIYDHLSGGLCRYSTDKEWLAPHFEKMLYDNALFIISLSNAFLLTKKDIYKNAIVHICEFLFSEMKDPAGGYYAAIDADSEGVEGKFYVWDKKEIDEILGNEAGFFNAYYDVNDHGNWEGKNILRERRSIEEVIREQNITVAEGEKILEMCREKLLKIRHKRIRPGTDDKILLGWNALLITAFCKAYAALQDVKYKIAAEELYHDIEKFFCKPKGAYSHTYKNGESKFPAFADDYAYLAEACIQLQEITADASYLLKAKEITCYLIESFSDEENVYFYFTSREMKDTVVRKIELYDGATPSANAVIAQNLIYLSLVFEIQDWHRRGLTMLASLKKIVTEHPTSFGVWGASAINEAAGINEIAIIGADIDKVLPQVLSYYIPNKILQGTEKLSNMPLFKKKPCFKKSYIYLCRNYECCEPVGDSGQLKRLIEEKVF